MKLGWFNMEIIVVQFKFKYKQESHKCGKHT
jgi:hypothetical protein